MKRKLERKLKSGGTKRKSGNPQPTLFYAVFPLRMYAILKSSQCSEKKYQKSILVYDIVDVFWMKSKMKKKHSKMTLDARTRNK